MNSPPVQKRAVPAAKIDEPKLADILQVNKRRRDTLGDSNTIG